MNTLIAKHQLQIRQLCQRYGVERLDIFGSAATERFDVTMSDLDFIVHFLDADAPGIAQRFFELAEGLEKILQRPVDLLTDKPFVNPYFSKSVAATRQNVYDRRNQEIPI